MEKISQLEQLKLNVTNINSFLIAKNKEQIKLRYNKKRLEIKKEDILKRKEEERKLEISSSPLGKTSEKIKESVSSGGSILDKLLNFGGLILAGILVNNLPGIIDKVKEIIDSIVNFLTPIQSGFNLIKAFFTGEIEESQYDVDKKRFDDALANINEEGGLIDQLAEKAGPLEGLIKTLKPAIELVRNKIGGNKTVLAKKGGKEGVLNKETGEFTERQFTSAERQKYTDQSKEKLKKRTERGSGMASFRQDAAKNAALQRSVMGESSGPSKKVSGSLTGTKEEKWAAVMAMAKNAGAKYPELVAAQFALESAWGTALAAKNNFFGIKATDKEDATVSTTEEVYGGKRVTIDARFKNFATPQDAINHLVNQWYKDYRGYSGVNNAPNAAAAALKLKSEGYATDPVYAQSLQRLMKEYSNIQPKQLQPKITPVPDKGDKTKVLNQRDPRKNRRGRTVAVQRVNTIQTALVPMPIPMKSSPSSVSQPQLPSIWST